MWLTLPDCSPRCWNSDCGSFPAWTRRGLLLFVLAWLLTLPGCLSASSAGRAGIPATPVLCSLQRAELNGVPGVWMDERDAGELALWINGVEAWDAGRTF